VGKAFKEKAKPIYELEKEENENTCDLCTNRYGETNK
jgi:hypothetical protein